MQIGLAAQFELEDHKHILIYLVTQAQEPQGCGQAEVPAKPSVHGFKENYIQRLRISLWVCNN